MYIYAHMYICTYVHMYVFGRIGGAGLLVEWSPIETHVAQGVQRATARLLTAQVDRQNAGYMELLARAAAV